MGASTHEGSRASSGGSRAAGQPEAGGAGGLTGSGGPVPLSDLPPLTDNLAARWHPEPAFQRIYEQISRDAQNAAFATEGQHPLFMASSKARIAIIGQAPGRAAQASQVPWNDRSGQTLRTWMGIDAATFYQSGRIAVLNCDFYFPGTGRSGDLPPRAGFAERWHPQLLALMPDIQLTLLVGSYAVRAQLGLPASAKLGDIVQDWRSYLPERLPLVHPSPRNRAWRAHNPWFEDEVVPALRARVAEVLRGA
jgi:uracil-DNA glycosylase